MSRYAHVLAFALTQPWALLPEMLKVIAGILAQHEAGVACDTATALVDRKTLPQPKKGSVAVIPVHGVIAPRMNLFSEMSGGTTFEHLSKRLHEAMHAKDVRTIVLDVNSPGGAVAGSTEFAQEILRARATKPIVAVAQYLMGSAAYHLSAVATEVVAAPSALVGGIGVYTIHDDLSKSLEKLGVTRTFITAGEGKVDGNSSQPLTETARARLAAAVDEAYDQFVTSVVRGRGAGMTPARVRGGWKAHVYTASEALELGMIDRIDTLDQTLARLLSASPDKTDQQLADTVRGVDTSQEPIGATDQDHASAGLATNALLQQLYTLEL